MPEEYVYPDWQKSSIAKWEKICERVEAKEYFSGSLIFSSGFSDLAVVSECGFCYFFRRCDGCPLKRKKICSSAPLGYAREYVFWQFVAEMNLREPDFEKALSLAQEILSAVKNYRHEEKK